MSSDSASSEVTYTSISSHGDPLAWAVDFFRRQEPDSPEAPPASLDYVPGPEEPEQAPLLPDYVPGPEYPEYLAPSDEEVPVEDQPYVIADSPIALSPGYVADSDPEEDSEDGPVDYPADGGDGDDDNSSDDDEEEEEASEEEEDKHLAPADSVVAPVVDHIRLRKARNTVRLEPPMSPSMEARIAEYAVAPTPPSPLPSPELPWSLTAAPRPTGGHRADYRFIDTMDAEIRRQRAEEVGYGIRDVWVDPTEAVEEVEPTTLEGVNARVTELAAVQEQVTQDIYVVIEDGQDRQTQLFQRVDGLVEDRQFHYESAQLL
ncbi:hypothetical protein Tco_1527068, partial [Tanacetum coccineum]